MSCAIWTAVRKHVTSRIWLIWHKWSSALVQFGALPIVLLMKHFILRLFLRCVKISPIIWYKLCIAVAHIPKFVSCSSNVFKSPWEFTSSFGSWCSSSNFLTCNIRLFTWNTFAYITPELLQEVCVFSGEKKKTLHINLLIKTIKKVRWNVSTKWSVSRKESDQLPPQKYCAGVSVADGSKQCASTHIQAPSHWFCT